MADPAMLRGQVRYANRNFWRQPIAAFFTLVFPLTFLVILAAIAGNEVIDPYTGLRFAQFLTPAFAVFGTCMAAYVSLAAAVAYPRRTGVLKRLRGTPLPSWMYIAGRIISAVWVSVIALVLLVGVGVTFYGVQIVWRTLPALLVTFLIGIACFAALGLAVVSLVSSPNAVQGITNSTLILLAFVSGLFAFGDLPGWAETVGWIFPLRHFVAAVADCFNPYLQGSGFYVDHLAVMSAWGLAGAVVAVRFFRWEPGSTQHETAHPAPHAPVRAPATALPRASVSQRPSAASMVRGQTVYAVRQVLRDPMSVFFGVVFPVLLLVFFGTVYGSQARIGGLPLPQYVTAAFAVYGIAVLAYVNLAGAVAEQRSQLTLKRLRGTPLPPWAYFAGRLLAALLLGLVIMVVMFTVGGLLLGVTLPFAAWLPTLSVFVLGIACFAALGLMVASTARSPQTVIAIALATLMLLSFVSDIFVSVEDLPGPMDALGWTFPLRHLVHAAVTASSGGALDASWWLHAAVVALWLAGATAITRILFRWQPAR